MFFQSVFIFSIFATELLVVLFVSIISHSQVLQGQIYLEQLNDLDSTEKIIETLEGSLEDADGVTPVHGRFYKLASEYYRLVNLFSNSK